MKKTIILAVLVAATLLTIGDGLLTAGTPIPVCPPYCQGNGRHKPAPVPAPAKPIKK